MGAGPGLWLLPAWQEAETPASPAGTCCWAEPRKDTRLSAHSQPVGIVVPGSPRNRSFHRKAAVFSSLMPFSKLTALSACPSFSSCLSPPKLPHPDSCPTAWFQSVLAGRGPRFDPDSGRESPALSHRAGCLSSCWGILGDVHAARRALDASLEGCRDIGRPPRPWRTTWACSAVQIATEVEGLA